MKIIQEKPPNWDKISDVFEIKRGMVFTFGETIYNPDGLPISRPLLEHEEVHSKQQKDYGIEKWWDRYMVDPAFRLAQELPAYQAEYRGLKRFIKDRNKLSKVARLLAETLSSPMYGEMISQSEAYNAIRRKEPFAFSV